MEQFFDSDHRQKTYYGLGYVMRYDPLADLLYSNSMSIAGEKAVKRTRRESRHLPSPSPRSPTEMPTPTDEEEEWWGEWNWWGKLKLKKYNSVAL